MCSKEQGYYLTSTPSADGGGLPRVEARWKRIEDAPKDRLIVVTDGEVRCGAVWNPRATGWQVLIVISGKVTTDTVFTHYHDLLELPI